MGCGERIQPTVPIQKNKDITQQESKTTRFEISRVETFSDGLSYAGLRGIYILKDNLINKEYIGISGIGISELGSHTVGKSTHTDER